MKTNFGRRRLDLRILLPLGLMCVIAILWMIWPRCASQAPCSCTNQVAANLPFQSGIVPSSQGGEADIPQFMSDIAFSVVMNNRAPTSGASTTRVVSAGEKFFRQESSPRLDWGKRELVIKSQKDNWIINLFNRDALHYESIVQPTTVKVPIFYQGTNFNGDLLVGEEIKFFTENNAQKTIESNNAVYELKIPDGQLRLVVDLATDKPIKIDVINQSSPFKSYSVKYITFERRAPFNPQLFQVPSGLIIREWDLKGERQTSYEGWKSEDPALLNYYLKPDPQTLLTVFERLPTKGIPEMRLPFIELAAAILKRESSVILPFVRVAKQSVPDLQIWAALALRGCRSEECLKVLKTNPFGFVDEGFKEFVAVAEDVKQQSNQPATRRSSIDDIIANFIVFGDKDSLGKVITFLDSRIELSGEGREASGRPASLDSAPPGIVELIKQIATVDPTVKAYLKSRQEAKSKSAAEILNQPS